MIPERMHYGRGKQRPLRLETGTHNKAIQKALESYRVSDEQKNYLRTLKITQNRSNNT